MDKFTKVRNIGKGNMGTCALAKNNEDGKYYVIKQVDLTRMNKKERQQSLNEARVLSSLRHPNIINYVDSFLAKKSDHLCIVMEFADGGDISSRIKKNYGVNFRESQVLDWFIQLVLSLHYVHQRKILHRDVKTQNVFLTSDNVVKLGDFGIARTLNNTYDQAKTFVGTPYYLSPELILERPYDHRSDVWALGVVLYELLTLKHPFNATDMKGLMQRILKVQYDPVPMMYTTDMRNIVPRLLMKDPSQRIELKEVLELPIVQRRLHEWLKGDVVPKKYLDAVLKQNLLPDSVTKAFETPSSEREAAPPVESSEATPVEDGSTPLLPPLHSSPRSPNKAPPAYPSARSHASERPVPRSPGITPPVVTPRVNGTSSNDASNNNNNNHNNNNVNSNGNAPQSPQLSAAQPPLKQQPPQQQRAAPSYKYYRAPNSQVQVGVAPPMYGARNYRAPYTSRSALPSRLSNLDNFYQQLNYYQQGNGRAGASPGNHYRQYPQSHGLPQQYSANRNPSTANNAPIVVSSRRVASKRPDQPNAAHLTPLFRPPNPQAPSPKPLYDAAQPDIKAMLQRAAFERAQRRMGNTP